MSTNLSEITSAIYDLLDEAKRDLSLKSLSYGDVNLIPAVPHVAVVPQGVDHVPTASFMLAQDEIEVHLFVYHGKIQDVRQNIRECLEFAESVRDTITEDKTLGGLVNFSWVTAVDLGVSHGGDDLMMTTRIVWRGRVRTQF